MFFIFILVSFYIHSFYTYFSKQNTNYFKINTHSTKKIDNFCGSISSSLDDDFNDELVLQTLLSTSQDMVHGRGESSYREKKRRK